MPNLKILNVTLMWKDYEKMPWRPGPHFNFLSWKDEAERFLEPLQRVEIEGLDFEVRANFPGPPQVTTVPYKLIRDF